MPSFSTHRIGMRPAGFTDDFVGPMQNCQHGFKLGPDGKGMGCNMCESAFPDEFISRGGRRLRRNPGLGMPRPWMPLLGGLAGVVFTYLQGDTDTPSLAVGAVAGGIFGAFVGSIQLDDEEEVAKENVGPAELAAGAGMLAKGAYKAAVRKAIKTQTDQIAELSQQLSQQVKASGVLDEDDDDDKKRNGKARRNPVPWVRGLIVVGGTVGTLWGLKQLEWI